MIWRWSKQLKRVLLYLKKMNKNLKIQKHVTSTRISGVYTLPYTVLWAPTFFPSSLHSSVLSSILQHNCGISCPRNVLLQQQHGHLKLAEVPLPFLLPAVKNLHTIVFCSYPTPPEPAKIHTFHTYSYITFFFVFNHWYLLSCGFLFHSWSVLFHCFIQFLVILVVYIWWVFLGFLNGCLHHCC